MEFEMVKETPNPKKMNQEEEYPEESKVPAKPNNKHEDEDERDTDFDCPHCMKSFANKNSLKKHKKTASHKARVDEIGEIERQDPVYFPNIMDGKTLQIMCPFTSNVTFKKDDQFDFVKQWNIVQVKKDLYALRRGKVPKDRGLVRYTNINKSVVTRQEKSIPKRVRSWPNFIQFQDK